MGKKQQVKSDKWFIRVTKPWADCSGGLAAVRQWLDFSGAMVGYHIGTKTEKPHIHIVLSIKSAIQDQSMGVRIRKTFGVSGNKEYCVTAWDGNPAAMSYLFHDDGGRVEDYGFNLTADYIERLKESNRVIQEQVKQAKEKAGFKVVEYVLDKIMSDREADSHDYLWTRQEICECIVEAVYNKQFYYPGDFALGKYIMEIEIKQTRSVDERKCLAAGILRRLRLE